MSPRDPDQRARFSLFRLIPLFVLVALFVAFFVFGLNRHLSLEALKEKGRELLDFAHGSEWGAPAFALILALIVAASIPISPYVSIVGGYLFGVEVGAPWIIAGVVAGCTTSYGAARLGLAEPLRALYGARLQRFENGFRRNALSYLFVLRLIPVVPFSIVNFASAIFGVPLWKFVAGTAGGFLPAAILYAYIGHEIARARASDGSLMRPEFLVPLLVLALLALLPLLWRALARRKAG
jgi:uncharacterized membrane protein YdjX (TVP38/TMEM64 family)